MSLISNENTYELKLYIPRLHITCGINEVARVFQEHTYHKAKVRRVDFVALPEDESISKDYQSAFVYLICPIYHIYNTGVCSQLYESLCKNQPYKIYPYNNKNYWIILNNTKPVADTKLNIHQIAENAQILEKKVADQEEIIKAQNERISRLEELIKSMVQKI
jgi:hypothetical protein